jgi:quinol monooxygenase YgiN
MSRLNISSTMILGACCFIGSIMVISMLGSGSGSTTMSNKAQDQTIRKSGSAVATPIQGEVIRHSEQKNAFLLGVTIKFKTLDAKEEFKRMLLPLAQYVAQYEPNTISYEMCEADNNPLQVYMLERYKTKQDYLEIHRKAPIFLDFRAKLQAMSEQYELSGQSYIESNMGFVCANSNACQQPQLRDVVAFSNTRKLAADSQTHNPISSDVYVVSASLTAQKLWTIWAIKKFLNPTASFISIPSGTDLWSEATRLGAVVVGEVGEVGTHGITSDILLQHLTTDAFFANAVQNERQIGKKLAQMAADVKQVDSSLPKEQLLSLSTLFRGIIRSKGTDVNAAIVASYGVFEYLYEGM